MCRHRWIPLAASVLAALATSGAHAEGRWSGTAHAGLVFTKPGVSSGAWVGLHRTVAPNRSLGVEAGYVVLSSGFETPVGLPFAPLTDWQVGADRTLRSASVVFRGRSAGPVRLHMLTSFGYYDLETRTLFANGPDEVQQEKLPGFAFAIGLSGAGLLRPGFQLRWDEMIRPHNEYMDVISFAVGLHVN